MQVQVGRNLTVPDRENDLSTVPQFGRAFQVADIGFRRSRPRAAYRWADPERIPAQKLDFDRVAQAGACSVSFNVLNLMWLQAGVAKRVAN